MRGAYHRLKRAVTFCLVASGLMLAPGVASGQTNDQLRDRFREECRAQYPELRGAAHTEERAAKVSQCIKAKFASKRQDEVRRAAMERVPTHSKFELLEFQPWLAPANRGPAKAKGLIYFARGYPEPDDREEVQPIPYLLKTLVDDGWDIISGRVPAGLKERGVEYAAEGASFLRRRMKELKAQGYRRIVLAGHSWGGWIGLLAARAPDFDADVMLLSAPNTFGPRISPVSKGPNPVYRMSITELPGALKGVRTATVMLLPDDDTWDPDPGQRGAISEKYFAAANVPSIHIVKPPGFFGHFAAWLPIFDYAYGDCIRDFIEHPKTVQCVTPQLTNDDFRSIVEIAQVGDGASRNLRSVEQLSGRAYVAYTLTKQVLRRYKYVSPTERLHTTKGDPKTERVSFRNELHCAGDQCTRLATWAPGYLLEFDGKSGKLIGWWIEQR